MTRAYIVTKGQWDTALLKLLLPENLARDTSFVTGSGSYSAQSIARSILAVKQLPVALVVDANTVNEQAICERRDFLRELLHQAAAGVPCEAFLAIPEIEIVFFHDQTLLERISGEKMTQAQWSTFRFHPKEILLTILEETPERTLATLDSEAIRILQRYPLVLEIGQFLEWAAKTRYHPFGRQQVQANRRQWIAV